MLNGKRTFLAAVAPATYPLGEGSGHAESDALALVALSHTMAEQQLYSAMMAESLRMGTRVVSFTTRGLMTLTGIASYSTVRRGITGLMNKLSIERQRIAGDNGRHHPRLVYLVFAPGEILGRRNGAGLTAYPNGVEGAHALPSMGRAVQRVVDIRSLSRREAQVALCCAEGLTNAEIGMRLRVSEQTIKFHLRNVFAKFGVKRRAELVSRLFRDGGNGKDFLL
jgi:DNA-binding CsgD family transcriptional regulator